MSLKRSYNGIRAGEMRDFLEEKYHHYNNSSFISCDPISVPHRFTERHDREISGFLTAAISWGRRDIILKSSLRMLEFMGNTPYEFIMSASENDIHGLSGFAHRTFNGSDFIYFIKGLKHIYSNFHNIEEVILQGMIPGGTFKRGSVSPAISLLLSSPRSKK